ncbi:family 10 glycosylhydrolase [Leptolyngbya sp. AN02str]|uniref:family 10 glycosylhydrolase n=1 Tax=Leptolyngbya sp. AN02str TaxID=3423363 RepID=UPI003D31A696
MARFLSSAQRFFAAAFMAASSFPIGNLVALAQVDPSAPFCQFSPVEVERKESLRQLALQGDRDSQQRYRRLVDDHKDKLERCRRSSWLRNQALWIRLYPCDAQPGALEALFDKMVAKGYNQVYIEVFGSGQVMLPQNDNPTAWPSLIRDNGYGDYDLLEEAITKGRERGLKVYAWLFTMNFGYSYTRRPGTEQALARNGRGQAGNRAIASQEINAGGEEELFIDPYSNQAKLDYYTLVQAVLRRRPDGVLFDYIRYPRGNGGDSVASRVQDLWIYGPAAQDALLRRALNLSGQELIRRFVARGSVLGQDVAELAERYPQDPQPLWQGISLDPAYPTASIEQRRPFLQQQLWQLSVAHAMQGVVDFLNMAATPVQQRNIPAGAVFFPEGNQTVNAGGYDSRLQPWDQFPTSLEWHPMAYGICGNTGCIVSQVQRVLERSPNPSKVMPVLAGTWGQSVRNRPALESQMLAIHQVAPQIQTMSHFAYSWQEPQSDRDRKFCQLQ